MARHLRDPVRASPVSGRTRWLRPAAGDAATQRPRVRCRGDDSCRRPRCCRSHRRGARSAGGGSFGAPVQLAAGSYGIGVAADTDAAGSTTALVAGYGQRYAALRAPARRRLVGGDAAARQSRGRGRPGRRRRRRRRARDRLARRQARATTAASPSPCAIPAGRLSEPIAGRRRRRRRRAPPGARDRPAPATRCWPTTRATNKVHLNMRGAIADRPPQHRRRVLDADARRPDALEPAGRRTRARRHAGSWPGRTTAASTWSRSTPTGSIGKVKRIASPDRRRRGSSRPPASAGRPPWRGSTIAPAPARRRSPRTRYFVRALGRTAGRAFAHRTVVTTSDYVRGVSIAADEDGQRDPGVGPGALRRRSLGGQQRRHERGPRHHCAGREAVRRRRGSSPGGGSAT